MSKKKSIELPTWVTDIYKILDKLKSKDRFIIYEYNDKLLRIFVLENELKFHRIYERTKESDLDIVVGNLYYETPYDLLPEYNCYFSKYKRPLKTP